MQCRGGGNMQNETEKHFTPGGPISQNLSIYDHISYFSKGRSTLVRGGSLSLQAVQTVRCSTSREENLGRRQLLQLQTVNASPLCMSHTQTSTSFWNNRHNGDLLGWALHYDIAPSESTEDDSLYRSNTYSFFIAGSFIYNRYVQDRNPAWTSCI